MLERSGRIGAGRHDGVGHDLRTGAAGDAAGHEVVPPTRIGFVGRPGDAVVGGIAVGGDLGGEKAGRHAHDPDPVGPYLGEECLAEGAERVLRRRVHAGVERAGNKAAERRDVDDHPGPAHPHGRKHAANHAHSPPEVGVHDGLRRRHGHRLHGAAKPHPGVVHEHVDGTVALGDRGNGLSYGIIISHVEGFHLHRHPNLGRSGPKDIGFAEVPHRGADLVAPSGKGEGCLEAEPTATSGDNDDSHGDCSMLDGRAGRATRTPTVASGPPGRVCSLVFLRLGIPPLRWGHGIAVA